MANDLLSNESMLWTAAWQTSLMLALGLLASLIWSRRPARAHQLLTLAMVASLLVPALTQAVRHMNWGLFVRPTSETAATLPPDIDWDTTWAMATAADVEPLTAAPTETRPSATATTNSSLVPKDDSGKAAARESSEARLSPVVCLWWAWAILSGLAAIRLLCSAYRARVLVAARHPMEPPMVLRQALAEAVAKLGLRAVPELCVSSLAFPAIWCWGRRPVVFVGAGAGDQLASRDWVGVFCHELAHWRRSDHLTAALSEMLVVLLPWNPLAWWAKRRLAELAEHACDDWVLACGSPSTDYAESLVKLRLEGRLSLGLTVVSNRKRLEERIRRILGTRFSPPEVGRNWAFAAVSVTFTLAAVIALAQTRSELPSTASSPSPEPAAPAPFLGPFDVVASPDGKTLYVACAGAKQIAVVDPAGGKVSRTIGMPAEPTGLVLSPDGATLYVTCALPEGRVCAVDVVSGRLGASIPVGHGATGPAISPDGKKLYVCNRFNNNVAVIDLEAKKIVLVPTLREPYAAVVTPDGKSVFVINHLPIDRADSYEVASEITVIDTATNGTQTIRMLNGSTLMRGICLSPDGKFVYATHLLPRNQLPTTQVERGWMNTNVLTVIDARQKKLINTALLDDVDLGAADPWGVACTADGKTLCVTQAGTHELSVIDAEKLLDKLLAAPDQNDPDPPWNDLTFLQGLRQRVRLTGEGAKINGPRGLAVVGSRAYVAAYFTDNLSVVDLDAKSSNVLDPIASGPKRQMSVQRRGEMVFNDATLCHQHWQSCASCHPDARVDALNWDLLNDGIGTPKNVRSLLLAHRTPPSMSAGVLPTAEESVRRLVRHLFWKVWTEEHYAAVDQYLKSLKPVPSPFLIDGKLSPAARRGEKLFFDAKINCAKCHPKPLFTDLQMHDVGSRGKYDRRDAFDTPTLIECWRTAPYMHDGRYTTLKELLTHGKHGSQDGEINKLSEQQINDLVEFVLSL